VFRSFSVFTCFLFLFVSAFSYSEQQKDYEQQIEALLSKMTLEEKIGQTALRGHSSRAKADIPKEQVDAVREGRVGAFLNAHKPSELTSDKLQKIAVEESRLGIPLLFGRDVIHGFKTIFPIPLGLASSWNPEMAKIGARVSAEEATAFGLRWTYAPMMDIARDARWGRIAESFGEDPYMNSIFSVAMIEGFQTDDLSDETSMAACAKHYVGYGAAEGGRDYNTALIPERELRDIYLPPFHASVKAGVASLMTSFSEVDGVPATGSEFLLNKILREEWGFDGFVVSDWESVTEMIAHGYVKDEKHAAERAAKARMDMEMMSTTYEDHFAALIKEGKVSEKILDDMVRNILRIKFRLGLFEKPYRTAGREGDIVSDASLAKAKEAAIQSAVLLKNDGVLPLAKQGSKVALIGPMANAPHEQMGTWVFDGEKKYSRVPLDAFKAALEGKGKLNYAPGLEYSRDLSKDGFKKAIRAAKKSDVIVYMAGEEAILSGEAHSRANINLPGKQEDLLKALAKTGKPIVLVLMAGRPLTINHLLDDVDAVLVAFHPGTMAGPALADLVFGERSPSGRLPVTWPIEVGQIPIYYNHKNTGRPADNSKYVAMYDIPVEAWQSSLGNQSHYLDLGYQPAFPFGFGLTYSEFEYSNLQLSSKQLKLGGSIEVSATIKNVGKFAAEEVVQLYVRDLVGDVTRPVRELKGFQKVSLAPGQSKQVRFKLHTDDLSFHNLDMKSVTEPGEFHLWVASHAATGLQGAFEVVD